MNAGAGRSGKQIEPARVRKADRPPDGQAARLPYRQASRYA